MITPDSEEAFVIKDCIKSMRSFRVGTRGICVGLFVSKDRDGWLMRIPRAGLLTLNCDTLHYDEKKTIRSSVLWKTVTYPPSRSACSCSIR